MLICPPLQKNFIPTRRVPTAIPLLWLTSIHSSELSVPSRHDSLWNIMMILTISLAIEWIIQKHMDFILRMPISKQIVEFHAMFQPSVHGTSFGEAVEHFYYHVSGKKSYRKLFIVYSFWWTMIPFHLWWNITSVGFIEKVFPTVFRRKSFHQLTCSAWIFMNNLWIWIWFFQGKVNSIIFGE